MNPITYERDHAVFRLPAQVTLANAQSLRSEILNIISQLTTRLILDLSDVEFADSSGLSMMLVCITCARRQGGDIVLLNPRPRVQALVELTRLNEVVAVMRDLPQAVESLSASVAA